MTLTLWLRHETKAQETRTPLTPEACALLAASGRFRLVVERSPTRVHADAEFEAVEGVEMAASGAWRELKPSADVLIIGLKELGSHADHADGEVPIGHDHVLFAHVFKGQLGAEGVLRAWAAAIAAANEAARPAPTLYDLEFLDGPDGRNIGARMSPFAGFAGAAHGLRAWLHRATYGDDAPAPAVKAAASKGALVAEVRGMLEASPSPPRVLVIGALGGCGRGALELLRALGLDASTWDLAETAERGGGPFPEAVTDFDVLLNCVYLRGPIPPFVTDELVDAPPGGAARRLSLIVDVSCDPDSPHNPLRLGAYSAATSWEAPTARLRDAPAGLHILSIDNLPSSLPREASAEFAAALAPALAEEFPAGPGWARARGAFEHALAAVAQPAASS